MRLRGLYLAGALALSLPTISYAQTALDLAEGSWEVVPGHELNSAEIESYRKCDVNPLMVRIDHEARRYYYRYDLDDPENGADILRSESRFFSIQYDNEERLMSDGNPHIWIMYFQNDDEFVWVRQDWIKNGGSTPSRRRCKLELG